MKQDRYMEDEGDFLPAPKDGSRKDGGQVSRQYKSNQSIQTQPSLFQDAMTLLTVGAVGSVTYGVSSGSLLEDEIAGQKPRKRGVVRKSQPANATPHVSTTPTVDNLNQVSQSPSVASPIAGASEMPKNPVILGQAALLSDDTLETHEYRMHEDIRNRHGAVAADEYLETLGIQKPAKDYVLPPVDPSKVVAEIELTDEAAFKQDPIKAIAFTKAGNYEEAKKAKATWRDVDHNLSMTDAAKGKIARRDKFTRDLGEKVRSTAVGATDVITQGNKGVLSGGKAVDAATDVVSKIARKLAGILK